LYCCSYPNKRLANFRESCGAGEKTACCANKQTGMQKKKIVAIRIKTNLGVKTIVLNDSMPELKHTGYFFKYR
jgi:hypothetical protein